MRRTGFLVLVLGVGLVSASLAACESTSETPGGTGGGTDGGGLEGGDDNDGAAPFDAGETTDAADASGDAATCSIPGTFGSEQCHACLGATCCDVISACDGDGACKPLMTCIQECLPLPPDDVGPCIDQCLEDHPDGQDLWTPVETCIVSEAPYGCAIECSGG